MEHNWRDGSNFTTQQFLIGLSISHIKNKDLYNQALNLGDHKLIKSIYCNLYNVNIHHPNTPCCYEQAIKLFRRSKSPYNQTWTPELMYS